MWYAVVMTFFLNECGEGVWSRGICRCTCGDFVCVYLVRIYFLSGSEILFYLVWIYFLSGLYILSIRLGYIFYLARIFLEALSLRSVCGMSFV